tara:strand:- start:2846 stop:3970 length:1125 start_codon:yes stop_codon:yes gene_type:complete
MKQKILDNIKNIFGWKTHRKIIVISVDDYGSVRLNSNKSMLNMINEGLSLLSRFDRIDSLETKDDLSMLYEALTSVKDKNGNHAVFTPFSLPCNINFEKMSENNFERYEYELLPQTFAKLSAENPKKYEGTWGVWKEGIEKKIMVPQFHGREHFNLKIFNEKLSKKDPRLLLSLKNKSNVRLKTGYDTIKYTAAFDFEKIDENSKFENIIKTGLDCFEKVFGYKSLNFNSAGGRENPIIHKYLKNSGIMYLDTPFIKKEHQGNGVFKKVFNYTGKKNHLNMTYLVRNVVFEPTKKRNFDWVDYSLKQVEAAFFWNRPAIISSHRINFCGHIDPKNRELGLDALRALLRKIVKRWPEVEFMSADKLGRTITNNSK